MERERHRRCPGLRQHSTKTRVHGAQVESDQDFGTRLRLGHQVTSMPLHTQETPTMQEILHASLVPTHVLLSWLEFYLGAGLLHAKHKLNPLGYRLCPEFYAFNNGK